MNSLVRVTNQLQNKKFQYTELFGNDEKILRLMDRFCSSNKMKNQKNIFVDETLLKINKWSGLLLVMVMMIGM